MPAQDLNHWRFSSTRLTSATSTLNKRLAMRVRRSNRSSAMVSSTLSERNPPGEHPHPAGYRGFQRIPPGQDCNACAKSACPWATRTAGLMGGCTPAIRLKKIGRQRLLGERNQLSNQE